MGPDGVSIGLVFSFKNSPTPGGYSILADILQCLYADGHCSS